MSKFYNRRLPSVFDTFFTQVNKRQNYNTRSGSNMFYTLPKGRTNYGIFNIRFKGPKVWNSISENLKTFSISNFKESVQSDLLKDFNVFLVTCVLISSCVVSQITCKLVFYLLNSVTFSSSSYINVLYSFINLTILDFLHSVEIAFFLFSLFFLFLFMCAFVLQFSCWPLILFNGDINWLPGSASPHGFSRQPEL